MKQAKPGFLGNAVGILFCFLLLLPSYSINNGVSHDWGGDFAHYVKQAENIVLGLAQSDNDYIYNTECPGLGPPTYPVGFPILLSPMIAFYGNDMAVLIDFMAVLFILFGIMCFVFIRPRSGFLVALLAAATITYHPSLLEFKREVMSDLPFALFVIISIYLARKKKWVLAGLIMAFAASIRTVGLTLIVASIGLLIIDFFSLNDKKDKAQTPSLLGSVIAVFGYFVINHFIFKTDSESGYKAIFSSFNFQETISGNIELYWNFTKGSLFANSESGWITAAFVLLMVMAVQGWRQRAKDHLGLAELWLPIYILVLTVYPYRGGALRFILPTLPFLFYYSGIAIKNAPFPTGILGLALLVTPIYMNMERTRDFAENWSQHLSGPQSLASVELFDHIKKNVPENESVLFLKPRVLALYTGRKSMSNERKQSPTSIKNQLDTIPIQYVLSCKEIWNPGIDSLVATYPEMMQLEFENSDFKLYHYVATE